MPQDLALACKCGQVAGHLTNFSPRIGTHAVCHCSSCRAGELYCGAPDPGTEGVGVFQTSPHLLTITQGLDQLSPFSFGKKNLLRWRARCCGVPLFNTSRNPRTGFVGIRTTLFKDPSALGPIDGHAYRPTPNGKTRHEGLPRLIWGALSRIVANRVTGRWRNSPFFEPETGETIAPITVVPSEDRKKLLDAQT